MQPSSGHRALFLTAGAFNVAVALAFAVPASPVWRLVGMAEPADALIAHLFLVFVALFGCAYAWIAIDPRHKGPLILLGATGKIAVAVTCLIHVAAGETSARILPPLAGDVVFAGLFVRAFLRARR
jgi:hypothetical protein